MKSIFEGLNSAQEAAVRGIEVSNRMDSVVPLLWLEET